MSYPLSQLHSLLKTDVLVIGGGPAGSLAATLLVECGSMPGLREKKHQPCSAEPEQMTAN